MPQIKLCGMTRLCDIEAVNNLKPEYIGFVFWPKSKRNVSEDKALELKRALLPQIQAVGVFVDEDPGKVADLLNKEIIDMAQLHGHEDEKYIKKLRELASGKEIIQAFQIKSPDDVNRARNSSADYLLLDSGTGSGRSFNWDLIREADFSKSYFLAGGLAPDNVRAAIEALDPMAVDVSSGIETDGLKDEAKMKDFVEMVRGVHNE